MKKKLQITLCLLAAFCCVGLEAQDFVHPIGDGAGGFVSTAFDVDCGATFIYTDSGGLDCDTDAGPPLAGSYDNNANTESVFCPTTPGAMVSIEFWKLM